MDTAAEVATTQSAGPKTIAPSVWREQFTGEGMAAGY